MSTGFPRYAASEMLLPSWSRSRNAGAGRSPAAQVAAAALLLMLGDACDDDRSDRRPAAAPAPARSTHIQRSRFAVTASEDTST